MEGGIGGMGMQIRLICVNGQGIVMKQSVHAQWSLSVEAS